MANASVLAKEFVSEMNAEDRAAFSKDKNRDGVSTLIAYSDGYPTTKEFLEDVLSSMEDILTSEGEVRIKDLTSGDKFLVLPSTRCICLSTLTSRILCKEGTSDEVQSFSAEEAENLEVTTVGEWAGRGLAFVWDDVTRRYWRSEA